MRSLSPGSVCTEKKNIVSFDPGHLPDIPRRVLVGLQDGYCNLRCPSCHVHGFTSNDKSQILRGQMSLLDANKIFQEIRGNDIFVSPVLWAEPLLIKNFKQYVQLINGYDLKLFVNTNGLLLNDELADFLVSSHTHSVFVSIDATTRETLRKVRGVDSLSVIHDAVFRLIEARGVGGEPRIGVSFSESQDNAHEKEAFISYWLEYVDVVRVNYIYESDNSIKNINESTPRVPCGALYDTMAINHKGDALVCCLDSSNQTFMGNVLSDGVASVWKGARFQEVRHYHEAGQFEKVELCRKCDVWRNSFVEETTAGGILIRRSPTMTYYNRLDRLSSWRGKISS